mmetsp:Transcript_24257/g.46051  ORF Transcript_24257/g.46051 Transcript_24257/m.46051 type:complete len:85 (+) Transcript_24257:461-715(+)
MGSTAGDVEGEGMVWVGEGVEEEEMGWVGEDVGEEDVVGEEMGSEGEEMGIYVMFESMEGENLTFDRGKMVCLVVEVGEGGNRL